MTDSMLLTVFSNTSKRLNLHFFDESAQAETAASSSAEVCAQTPPAQGEPPAPRKEVKQTTAPQDEVQDASGAADDSAGAQRAFDRQDGAAAADDNAEARARFSAKASALARSIAQTAQIYPAFDLQREMRAPRFLRLIDAGLSVREAYETMHRDELLRIAVESASEAARQNAAHSARLRRSRPEENGAAAAVVTRRDPGAMSRAQREEISRRVLRGEKVTF